MLSLSKNNTKCLSLTMLKLGDLLTKRITIYTRLEELISSELAMRTRRLRLTLAEVNVLLTEKRPRPSLPSRKLQPRSRLRNSREKLRLPMPTLFITR